VATRLPRPAEISFGRAPPSPDSAKAQLAQDERAWMDAYTENDRDALERFLAGGGSRLPIPADAS
jgi:hypothetical protein